MLVSPVGGTGDVRHGGSWRSCTAGSSGADEGADVAGKSIFRTHSLVIQEIAWDWGRPHLLLDASGQNRVIAPCECGLFRVEKPHNDELHDLYRSPTLLGW